MSDSERVLFVHAHPDDETIETGGTIATLIGRGASVTVLTCTRGERGEVLSLDPADARVSPAKLATLRTAELRRAMTILGVTDHRFLGDADARSSGRATRRYRDSGMRWGANGAEATDELDADSLVGAEFADVAADIAAVILDVRPDVIVSYDERGGYGHPDHVRAREAALHAADVYGIPCYAIDSNGELAVDVSPVLDRKRAALGAYRSQLVLEGDSMLYPGGQRQPVTTVERYSAVGNASDEPIPYPDQPLTMRVATGVIGGVIGVALGGLLTVYHQFTVRIAGQNIWIGAIAAVLIVAAVLAGFRLAFATRMVAAFAGVAVLATVGVLSFPSASGTQLIPENGPGILWEIAPTVLAFVVVAWPQAFRRRPGKIGN